MASGLPAHKSIRRVAIATVLTALLIDVAAWTIACQRLDSGFDEAVAAASSSGWTVTTGPSHWRGWPVRAVVERDLPALVAGPMVAPAGLDWRAGTLALILDPLHPLTLTARPGGDQTIAAAGLPNTPFHAARFDIAIDLSGADPVHVNIAGLDAATRAGRLAADALALDVLPLSLAVHASGVTLPDGAGGSVQPRLQDVAMHLANSVPFPAARTPAASAEAWQAADGRVTLTAASLRWDALAATATGAGGLDPRLQPMAELQVEATGLPAMIDRLVETGAVARPAGTAAKAVLGLLAAPAQGRPVVLPVAFRDGVLSVARVALFRLPPLVWP